jgi:lipoprotein-anchoring transpeptidase ErfK/SrfK
MRKLALALAATAACSLSVPTTPAFAAVETIEAQMTAASAASVARQDLYDAFGEDEIKPGNYVWRDVPKSAGEERVVISLSDQLAYLYRGDTLVAAASISTAKAPKITPTGIFTVLEKRPMYHSKKYDNAPMPFMQRIDDYGIAMHAGYNPGEPASHGCIRLPAKFASRLYKVTGVGTPVLIGA